MSLNIKLLPPISLAWNIPFILVLINTMREAALGMIMEQ